MAEVIGTKTILVDGVEYPVKLISPWTPSVNGIVQPNDKPEFDNNGMFVRIRRAEITNPLRMCFDFEPYPPRGHMNTRILEKREHYLQRIRRHLDEAVKACTEAQDYFTEHFDEEVFDKWNLKPSIESSLEDALSALEDDRIDITET